MKEVEIPLWDGMKKSMVVVLVLALGLGLIVHATPPLDYPHFSINSVGCESCHFTHNNTEKYLVDFMQNASQNIDDTLPNNLCWSCHNDVLAPYVKTHSSLQIDDSYGDWAMECRRCHWPHQQMQFRTYDSDAYLYSNISSSITVTTLTQNSANWTTNAYQGMVVIPNTTEVYYNYKISSNTNDTLNISGPMDLSKVSVGDTFAIVYGKLIKNEISTPNNGTKTVRFFRTTGANSFADGDATYDGVCEVCHSKTTHFRNDGNGSDQLHTNVGVAAGTNGTKCTTCHLHSGGFSHSGSGTGCITCHGHENGTMYDPDMSVPYSAGTNASLGKGTTTPHSTHTETDVDDQRGPGIYCDTCHDTTNFPRFKSGTDGNGDGEYILSETDVCDTCHSPNGSYNGVSSVGDSVGAKDNWNSLGVYNNTANLISGKEKWCAGCHDENAAVIQSVSAPNVIGDEDASFNYGIGYGFYKTGHGLLSSSTYPASGGVTSGAGRNCGDCHNSSLAHIDNTSRTFDCVDGCDSSEYRQSYRLNYVSSQDPMNIPLQNNTPTITTDYYRLCFNCHDSEPFTNSSNNDTNMKTDGVNRHEAHLDMWNQRYPADYNYSGSYNSRISCVICHNVHGTTQLTMVRDGKLIDREPGLKIWYNNDALVSYSTSNPDPPVPENLPLSASTGTIWRGGTASNLCTHCHGNQNTVPEYRTPFQNISQSPLLDWTGEINYITDGVNPDSTEGSANFVFRIEYSDPNNDAPTIIQVWVDEDNSSSYGAGEKYDMAEDDVGYTYYFANKIYTKTLFINSSSDRSLNYTFYANDGTANATGAPTNNSVITITACSADSDGDYVCDATDNCPNNANSNQYDSDSDGTGDVCDLSPFTPTVAGGQAYSLVLKSDGTVWAFGNNSQGELGDGTTTNHTAPAQVTGLTNIKAIAAGRYHGLAVADNGTLWSWGDDSNGQLGDDASLTDKTTPVQVANLTDIIAVAAGEYHSLALKSDGTVFSWGDDSYGQLGDDTSLTDKTTPVQVVDQNDNRITGIIAIAAGELHSLAILSNTSALAWGRPYEDQVGSGAEFNDIYKRASQILGADNITAIGGGLYHSVFVKNNDTAWGMGRNDDGQLGDGTTTDRTTPVQTLGLTNMTSVAGGEIYTLAMADNGTVWGYGDNCYGQLGVDRDCGAVGNATQALDNNEAFLTTVIGIATGNAHSIAVKSDGTIWVSGDNAWGQLGTTQGFGSYTERFYQISDFTTVNVPTLSWTGETNYTSDGVNPNSAVNGSNFEFRIKYTDNNNVTPSIIQVWVDEDDSSSYAAGEKYNMTEVDSGDTDFTDGKSYNKTLNLTLPGSINYRFYAFDGTYNATGAPTSDSVVTVTSDAAPPAPSGAVPSVAGGEFHSLALLGNGTVWAWGRNNRGQLGDGTTTQRTSPVQVSGLTNISNISAGKEHSLAVADNGTLWAWGNNTYGQLGDGTTTQRNSPIQVPGLTNIIAVAAGEYHSLALADNGTVWSWGRDNEGQLGDSGTSATDKSTPVQVVDQSDNGITGVTAIAAGHLHSLAMNSTGSVLGWGRPWDYQIGVAARTWPVWYRASQIAGLDNVTANGGGQAHSVFAQDNGTAWGLGENSYGRLGDGTTTDAQTPVQTLGLIDVSRVAAGEIHSLWLISNGTIWGAGRNNECQLGKGSQDWSDHPNAEKTSITDATAVAAGDLHGLAVKDNGTVSYYAWGDNAYGQMGIGTTSSYECTPVQVQIP